MPGDRPARRGCRQWPGAAAPSGRAGPGPPDIPGPARRPPRSRQRRGAPRDRPPEPRPVRRGRELERMIGPEVPPGAPGPTRRRRDRAAGPAREAVRPAGRQHNKGPRGVSRPGRAVTCVGEPSPGTMIPGAEVVKQGAPGETTSMRTPSALLFILLASCATATPVTTPEPAAPPAPPASPYDLVLEGGKVVDGTGAAWFWGDVAIRDGRIALVAPRGGLRDAQASERLDVRGMVVAPGFIDIQSHSRQNFLRTDGRVISKITQGITTEIMGEGGTNAPANEKTGFDPEDAPAGHDFRGPRGFDKWLKAMETHGASPNFGSFVGASTIRMYGKGMAPGEASPAELDSMRIALRNAMEDG